MPAKLKPSSKEYVRDARGKMTNKFTWKHYTPHNTSTEELKKMYGSSVSWQTIYDVECFWYFKTS